MLSLFLLTAYFGESSGGTLHGVQRGAMEVLAPIQEGANRALKPFRDLFGWFGDTLDAKDKLKKAEDERDRLRTEYAKARSDKLDLEQKLGLKTANEQGGLGDFTPVEARVIARSPSSWYQTFQINKGSSDGVKVDQPVVNGAGLVGKVKSVSDGNASVMLLTDPEFGVSAQALQSGEPGSVAPAVGAPGDFGSSSCRTPRRSSAARWSSPPAPAPPRACPPCARCTRAASRSAWSRASRPARASWIA